MRQEEPGLSLHTRYAVMLGQVSLVQPARLDLLV